MEPKAKQQQKEQTHSIEERILRGRENLGQVIEVGFIDTPMKRDDLQKCFPMPEQEHPDVFLIRESPEENIYVIFSGEGSEETFYRLTESPLNTIFLFNDGSGALATAYLSYSMILTNNNGNIVRERPQGLCY